MVKLKNILFRFIFLTFILFLGDRSFSQENIANTANANIEIIYSDSYLQDNNELIYATSGGFAEISGNKVELLVETIEEAKEIDKQRAEASLKRAKDRLKSKEGVDPKRAELALERAMNRLSISRK